MQLSPGENYTVGYVIDNHTDTSRDSYYVRAVIRNARTFATIDSLNLTNQSGTGTYTKDWQVPADTSGNGFYILITITVYTDSAYTAKSGDYGEKMIEHLVQVRRNSASVGGGGGGWYPDKFFWDKVRNIVEFSVDAKVSKIQIPEYKPEKVDFTQVLEQIGGLNGYVRAMEMPKQKDPDFTPVTSGIRAILDELRSSPKFEKTDMRGVMASLNALDERLTKTDLGEAIDNVTKLKSILVTLEQSIKDYLFILQRNTPQQKKVFKGFEQLFSA